MTTKKTAAFDQQQMTSAMGKARYLWTTFARRATSALALAAAAQAFGALAREMDAYDAYLLLQHQEEEGETPTICAYEEVLIVLSRAGENWYRAAKTLQASSEETLPTAFANREALVTTCLEQRLRLVEVCTHLLKLQLTAQQQQEQSQGEQETPTGAKRP